MTNKPLVQIDIDGVLADSEKLMRNYMSDAIGRQILRREVTAYDYASVLEVAADPALFTKALDYLHTDEGIMGCEMISGANDAMHELYKNFEVSILTNRVPSSIEATKRWLRHHGIPYDRLSSSKGLKVPAPGTLFVMDDAPHHALTAQEHGVAAILFRWPWSEKVCQEAFEGKHPKIRPVGLAGGGSHWYFALGQAQLVLDEMLENQR